MVLADTKHASSGLSLQVVDLGQQAGGVGAPLSRQEVGRGVRGEVGSEADILPWWVRGRRGEQDQDGREAA